MAKQAHSEVSAPDRLQQFQEGYGDEIDAGATLADILIATGDYLGTIVGSRAADAGMARAIAECIPPASLQLEEPARWRTVVEEYRASLFSELAIGAQLHDLAAYALYGIFIQDSREDGDNDVSALQHLVETVQAFAAKTPTGAWELAANNDLSRLVLLASARWALDTDQPVDPAGLAALAGVSEGRIRNMMSGADRELPSISGKVPANKALAWLAKRETFWNSIWRDQALPRYGSAGDKPLTEAVFAPVARDGSVFHPGLKRSGSYTIGEKGNERHVTSFEEALAELQRMATPYWRRPNAKQTWGSVGAVRWVRLDAADLNGLADNPHHRIPENQPA